MANRIYDIYLWKTIERIAFNPKGDTDLKKWLLQYFKFFRELREQSIDNDKPRGTKYVIEIDNLIMITFDKSFDLPKFKIEFTQNETNWIYEFDNKYLSELDIIDLFIKDFEKQKTNEGNKKQSNNKQFINKNIITEISNFTISKKNIEDVLKSMIEHPAIHVHLENISHEIRIGFNTKNPFLFLYHVAFQFSDYKNDFRNSVLKQSEFNRLVDIIERNINESTISSGVLFGLKK